MDWTEVTVSVDAKDVDRAGDIAQMVVPYGIYVEDYSHLEEEAWEIAHIDLIDEELLKKDRKGRHHAHKKCHGHANKKPFLFHPNLPAFPNIDFAKGCQKISNVL